ncbi:DUF1515 family protein [Mesorhizobium sp. M1252]|uniref:DUF1515 family protein n=1 Tax=Mesorhizobium sp. M1252 TaxID=2957073 RepID=UPI003339D4D3
MRQLYLLVRCSKLAGCRAEGAVSSLSEEMTEAKVVTAGVTRWKLMGLGAVGVTGMAAAALASLVTAYWTDIWRVLRGGWQFWT